MQNVIPACQIALKFGVEKAVFVKIHLVTFFFCYIKMLSRCGKQKRKLHVNIFSLAGPT